METQDSALRASEQELERILDYIKQTCGEEVENEGQVCNALIDLGYQDTHKTPEYINHGIRMEGNLILDVYETLMGEKERKPVVILGLHGPGIHGEVSLDRKRAA